MFSKKFKCLSLLAATTILCASCTTASYESTVFTPDATNALATFAEDAAPLKMLKGGDTYYSFVGTFGETSYALSVSDDITKTNIVYEPEHPAIVWFADANENYVTWCETSESGNTFFLYEKGDTEPTEFFVCKSDGYQIENVALYDDTIYFANMDYEKKTADVMCYHILDQTLESIYSAEFTDKYSITSLSISENILTVVTNVMGHSKLVNINLDTMEQPTITEVPKDAYFIFDAEYDPSTSTYALYYISTKNKEQIGTYKAGEEAITNIFTFSNSYYAYQDSISYIDGNIYWILQANRKSIQTIPERYTMLLWNHKTETFTEYNRTYHFSLIENDIYYFSFDEPFYYSNIILNCME